MPGVPDHRPDIVGPAFRIFRRPEGPVGGRFAATGTQAQTFVIAVNVIKAGRTRSDLDQRFAVHMQKDAFVRDHDRSSFFIPGRVVLTNRSCSPEGQVIRASDDPFLFKPGCQLRGKPAGFLTAANDQRQD